MPAPGAERWPAIGTAQDFNGGVEGRFSGLIDEVRISDTPRSADWIAAQHASMSDTFVSYELPEPRP